MTEYPSFGVVLAHLMDRRETTTSTLAKQAAIQESDLQKILDGTAPNKSHLRRIAPALGLHTADLFAIAWLDLPDDLAPLDPRAEYPLFHLAAYASRLSPEQGRELRQHANQMPQEKRSQTYKLPPPFNKFRHTPGGVLLRLFANRNLPRFAAYAIMGTTGRPLSPSTIFTAAISSKTPSPEALADYIAVLDIGPADLAIMTGFELPDPLPGLRPGTTSVADLIWDARRLTADQIRQLREMVKALNPHHDEALA